MKPERMKNNKRYQEFFFAKVATAKSCNNKPVEIDATDVVELSD